MRRALPSLACALALALAGCTSDGGDSSSEPSASGRSSTSTSPSTAPPGSAPGSTERPQAGRCYRLDSSQALASAADAPPVSCRSAHTAVTYSTGFLPLDPQDGAAPVTPRARRQVAQTCQRRLARYLGGSLEQRRLSLLTKVWFVPTAEQVAQGARWFRCDAIAPESAKRLLALPRPSRLRGILRAPGHRNAFATCGTARPGTPGFRRVACSRRHAWRAVASVSLGQGAYPPAARIFRRMDPRCTAAARQRARNKFSFSWAEERPTRAQWSAGRRYGLCWTAVRD